jgi:hypothetical protein
MNFHICLDLDYIWLEPLKTIVTRSHVIGYRSPRTADREQATGGSMQSHRNKQHRDI